MEAFIDAMEKERNERFKKPWTKLDKGTKLNRLLIFICEEKEKRDLDETQVKQLKKLLSLQCENGTLNKASDVDYSDETYHIVSIKHLQYDEEKEVYSHRGKAIRQMFSLLKEHFDNLNKQTTKEMA